VTQYQAPPAAPSLASIVGGIGAGEREKSRAGLYKSGKFTTAIPKRPRFTPAQLAQSF